MDRFGRGGTPTNDNRPDLIYLAPGRIILVALVAIGLIWLAWQIIANTVALNTATSSPETAVAWSSNEATALDELAHRELRQSDGDLNAARGFAERALRANPLDARALAALGQIAERQGDQARAGELMRLAGARTWRDLPTQAWLLKYEIQNGNFAEALVHVDAILRTSPRFIEQVTPVLAAFTLEQRPFDALNSLLASDPPWRGQALARLSTQLSDPGRLVQLYAALTKSQHPPDTNELRPYLDRLIKDGRYTDAYQSWRGTLAAEQRTKQTLLYNGDFALPNDGLPFNWQLQPMQGATIAIVASPGKENSRALKLEFSGTRASFVVRQLMLLPPGDYRFSGNVRAQDLRAERGLQWEISCAEAQNNVLGRTDLVARTAAGASFSVAFTVPQQDCRAQWLRLDIPARVASERQIEGQVWYDNFQIARAGGQ